MNSTTVTLLISFVTDFLITTGGVLLGAMITTTGTIMPSRAVWIVAIITGTVQAARRVQALIQPTAINQSTTIRTPEQLVAQTQANAQQIAAVTEAVTRGVATAVVAPPAPVPVTPQRIPVPVKDSS